MEIMNLILIALFIEGVISAIKPAWSRNGTEISVSEIVSMAIGVVIAVACRLNMLAGAMQIDAPEWFYYVLYIMTGIAIGRGPNFLYDLWNRIKTFVNTETLYAPETCETGSGSATLESAGFALAGRDSEAGATAILEYSDETAADAAEDREQKLPPETGTAA